MNISDLLKQPESSILDFKRDIYDFVNDKEKQKAKFLKDLIAFCNTIRTEKARIIFGVSEVETGQFKVTGISNSLDDAQLQNIANDNLYPQPCFHYKEQIYEGFKLGILEVPVNHYQIPLSAKRELHKIEKGSVYFRSGSMNTKADIQTIFNIGSWLTSLKPKEIENGISELELLVDQSKPLSEILPILIARLKNSQNNNLLKLVTSELVGFKTLNKKDDSHRYVQIDIAFKPIEFDLSPGLTSEQVKGFLRNSAATVLHNVPFHHPIIELEDYLNSFKMKKSIFANLNESGKKYFKNIDYDVSLFYFEETFSTLLRNIRQNLINEYTK